MLTASATVVVALVALLVFDVPAVTSMAYTVVLVVAGVVLSALTLQPAIAGAAGHRIAKPRCRGPETPSVPAPGPASCGGGRTS